MKDTTSRRLQVSVVEGLPALEHLLPEWRDLWSSSPNANPYNHPAWVMSWLNHFLDSDELHVVTIYRGVDLVGIAPFVKLCLNRLVGALPVLILAGAELADDGEPLLGPDPGPVADALADHLGELARCSRTSVVLMRLLDDGPLVSALAGSGLQMVETAEAVRLSVRFGDFDDAPRELKRLAKKRDIPRSRRRLSEQSDVRFVVRPCALQELDALLEMHRRRWDADDEQGLFATEAGRRFAGDALVALGRAGVAMLSSLEADGRPAAMELGYVVGDRYVGHKLTFDAELRKYGPGQMLVHEIAVTSLDRGLSEYEMGRGDSPYKRHWCNTERRSVSLALVRNGLLGSAQLMMQRAVLSRRIAARNDSRRERPVRALFALTRRVYASVRGLAR